MESRGTRLEWVKKVTEKVTIPSAVGGGVRNIEDMKTLFDLGVDKVSVNTAAVRNAELVKEASRELGKERLIVAIDGRAPPGTGLPRLEMVVKSGSECTGIDVVDWTKKVEEPGAGEI